MKKEGCSYDESSPSFAKKGKKARAADGAARPGLVQVAVQPHGTRVEAEHRHALPGLAASTCFGS